MSDSDQVEAQADQPSADQSAPPARSLRQRVDDVCFAVMTLGLMLFASTSYWGDVSWLADLPAHFTAQYFWVALVFLAIAIFRKNRIIAGAATVVLVVTAIQLAPYYFSSSAQPADEHRLKIMCYNVLVGNQNSSEIMPYLEDHSDYDVIVLFEPTPAFMKELRKSPILDRFVRYEKAVEKDYASGVVVISRYRIEGEIHRIRGLPYSPAVEFTLPLNGHPIQVAAVHPFPPMSENGFIKRNATFQSVADWSRNQTRPKVVIGDLNCTPFSRSFKKLVEDSGLKDSMHGNGIQASWPCQHLFHWPMRIPIDNCLVDPRLTVTSRELGPAMGSDHRPLLVEIAFAESND